MKMLVTKTALATAVALAALASADPASAQKQRAAPKSYDSGYSRPTNGRFSPEEQRIIDQITANGWRNGK
jgi:hypothetical protein